MVKRISMQKARVPLAGKLAVIIATILTDGTEFWWNIEAAKTT